MKQTISTLVQLFDSSDNIESASRKLAERHKKFSKKAALNVMQDIESFKKNEIDETKLSLFLKQAGL